MIEIKKKTLDEYKNELAIKNPTIEITGDYIDANTRTMHHCLIHDIYWETKPSSALCGVGCELCKKERFSKSRSKTNEEYILELKKKNPNIIPLEPYVSAKTKILHKCLIHGVEWKALPNNVLKGHGCPQCCKDKTIQKNTMSNEEYRSRVYDLNPNIEVLEEYKNITTSIKHRCKIDNHVWKIRPVTILMNPKCPKCENYPIIRTREMYIEDLKEINHNIELIGEYTNQTAKTLHKCKIDGHEWYVSPNTIFSGSGCPICNESHGERNIRFWLDKYNIKYESQKTFDDCRNIKPLPFDFYLPDYNACIEYDGEQHFRPVKFFGGEKGFKTRLKNDNIKTEYCKNNNIKLLRIPYDKDIQLELNNFLFI